MNSTMSDRGAGRTTLTVTDAAISQAATLDRGCTQICRAARVSEHID